MNNIKPFFKSCLPHLGALALFLVITIAYFYPAFEGKVLQQSDVTQFKGMSQELVEYGKPSGWTGSMFSGMPSYHITGYSSGKDFIGDFRGYVLGAVQSDTAAPIFILLITAYILFLIMGAPIWLAIVGAIATAFSSYNIIIIVAGHVTKAWGLAFVPLILSGMFLVFKRKYCIGSILFAFGLALQISSNHLQITYYTTLFGTILYLGYLVTSIKEKSFKDLGLTTGLLIAAVILAIGANITLLYTNYEMGQESSRGKSELTPLDSSTEPASGGLDKDYAFGWSYGKAETLTLMIPNLMGGESGGTLDSDSHFYKALKENGMKLGKDTQAPTYWGEKQFTSGPVYFGAIICFLFVFAFFIVRGPSKWWFLGATVLFVFLAWGKNLSWFNDFLFYNFPFYNKFRTPEMALVIPAFTFPVLAVMAIQELISGNTAKEKLQKALIYSVSTAGGLCLVLAIMPGLFFDFQSSYDAQFGLPDWAYDALLKDRQGLLQSDAWRSLIFILLAAALLFLYIKAKDAKKMLIFVAAGLLVLVTCDLWQVDKRYLNSDNYSTKKAYHDNAFSQTNADKEILSDPAISYRVLNLNNPFQDARTSYYHKSIGGYHAAKLKRYQYLIDRRLSNEMASIISTLTNNPTMESVMNGLQQCSTLNMLNMKYIIANPEQPPITNPFHFGNAWFVNSYRFVNNPDEEIATLETLNPRLDAVLDKKFESNLNGLQITPDSTASIELTSYAPDKLEYKSSSKQDGLAILSEIYYPYGWKATIDGKPVQISRADWVLRAIVVPAGDHQITLVFDPDEVKACGIINTIMSGLLVLLVISVLGLLLYKEIK